jgi:hypothetical protein
MRKVTMKISNTSILTTIALCVSLSACSTASNGTAPSNNGPSYGPTAQEGMRAPVVLNLRGPDPVPAQGDIKLDVEIQVREPIKVPTYLNVMVPPGAQLLSGAPSETLTLNAAGTLMRTYMVRLNGPLTQPIIATAEAKDPNGAFGFRAEKRYPVQGAAAPYNPNNTRQPPVPRPGMPPH